MLNDFGFAGQPTGRMGFGYAAAAASQRKVSPERGVAEGGDPVAPVGRRRRSDSGARYDCSGQLLAAGSPRSATPCYTPPCASIFHGTPRSATSRRYGVFSPGPSDPITHRHSSRVESPRTTTPPMSYATASSAARPTGSSPQPGWRLFQDDSSVQFEASAPASPRPPPSAQGDLVQLRPRPWVEQCTAGRHEDLWPSAGTREYCCGDKPFSDELRYVNYCRNLQPFERCRSVPMQRLSPRRHHLEESVGVRSCLVHSEEVQPVASTRPYCCADRPSSEQLRRVNDRHHLQRFERGRELGGHSPRRLEDSADLRKCLVHSAQEEDVQFSRSRDYCCASQPFSEELRRVNDRRLLPFLERCQPGGPKQRHCAETAPDVRSCLIHSEAPPKAPRDHSPKAVEQPPQTLKICLANDGDVPASTPRRPSLSTQSVSSTWSSSLPTSGWFSGSIPSVASQPPLLHLSLVSDFDAYQPPARMVNSRLSQEQHRQQHPQPHRPQHGQRLERPQGRSNGRTQSVRPHQVLKSPQPATRPSSACTGRVVPT
eukprot:TRINITY_DN38476_c0_g1_i1.p1 TRINITY_DN38476_c0_g1~~TRINITY_DN38476_c0_g1_i1.p1  ORF type:complete len:542 (-),score=51.47 TRINITY_DN38476_c0_g1_i1:113-1738(-)